MKIFGREKELRALREFLFASGGSGPRVALISGEAGMGKSLLARKLRPEVSERGGLFMEVTCNPVNSSELNFSTAMESAVESLGQSFALEDWRQSLAPYADIVSQRFKSLADKLEFGSASPAGRTASQQSLRFRNTACRVLHLVQALAAPIVIFLDDVHWADSESFELQRFLAQDKELSGLRILMAARPQECRANQWGEIQSSAQIHLNLEGLSDQVVRELIETRLQFRKGESGERARELVELTNGNPLYVATAALLMSSGLNDIKSLDRQQLLVQAVELLPKESLELLGQAACIGKSFSPQLLSSLSSIPESELKLRLESYVNRGILLRRGSIFEFRHDKLRDTVTELIPWKTRSLTHLTLGELLTAQSETYIQGVEHLGQGLELMDPASKEKFAGKALKAAREARTAGTAIRAFQLCRQGAKALGLWAVSEPGADLPKAWNQHEKIASQLCLEAAQAAEGSTEDELWQEPVALLTTYARDAETLARCTLSHARALSRKAQHRRAIEVCESYLRSRADYRPLPRKDLSSALRVARLIRRLRRLADDDFRGLPVAQNPLVRLKHEIMTVQIHSSVHESFDQVPFYTIRECESILTEGESAEGAHSLLAFSVAVGWRLKQQSLARQASDHCLRLLGDSNSASALQTKLLREVAIVCRGITTNELIRRLDDFHERCLSAGNFEFANASIGMGCFHRFFSGHSLHDLKTRLEKLTIFQEQYRARTADHTLRLLRWATSCCLTDAELPPPARVAGVHDFLGQTVELQTYLVNRRHGRALELALQKPADEIPVQGHLELYYWLLASLAYYWGLRSGRISRIKAGRLFTKASKRLRRWCSEREDRAWILRTVESLRASGSRSDDRVEDLVSCFQTARNQGVVHIAALLSEVLADRCKAGESLRYQQEAEELYAVWKNIPVRAQDSSPDVSLSLAIEELAACSTHTSLDMALLELVQKHSLADRLMLLRCRTRPYPILASIGSESDSTHLDPENSEVFPLSILDSALAQSRTLFFQADDLSSFPNDIYLQSANRPETLLVIPISFQSTVDEVIYLESRGMLDSSSATRSFLQLMGLQWKLFSLQIDRNEQLERQAEILDKVRKTRHQEALQKVALETRRTALATFLGVASHDLKAPLSAIGIWACQLPEGPEKQNIQAACSRATGLIHDYLDGMALELGNKIRLDKEKCDLAELVEQEIDHLLDSLECSVRERTRLLWDLDCVIVEADPMRLRQVVGNLIGNALKHCPGGTPINVFTRLDGEEAVLRVDDEGPGIEEAFQTKLFDAFETSAHRNGSGLGLWIVKKVAEAHRGRVGYERRDIGSSFWVRLPVAMS